MKPVICLIVCFLSMIPAHLIAQKTLTEGLLVYNISIESIKGEKTPGGSLNGAVLNVFLMKDKSRTEMVSTPGTETAVYDAAAGKGFILKEYSAQKLMITTTADNWQQKNHVNHSLDFKTDNTTQVVNNYTCKKAVAVTADDKRYTVYYDPSVIIANKTYNNAFPQLAGMPVRFELQSGNLIFKYDLVKYSPENISTAKFDAPKSGFRVMTFEENQQLKKGE